MDSSRQDLQTNGKHFLKFSESFFELTKNC